MSKVNSPISKGINLILQTRPLRWLRCTAKNNTSPDRDSGKSKDSDLRGFCAAPWVEGVLDNNGDLRACCHNGTVFSNWQRESLEKGWRSEEFQGFRKVIIEGTFPDDSCRNCYRNGTARSLYSELISPFMLYREKVFTFFNKKLCEISKIESQFILRKANEDTEKTLKEYFSAIRDLEIQSSSYPPEIKLALNKLTVIGRIAKAFLEGDLTPAVIAPFRQVQLIVKCNARCIQCLGRYTGEIVSGNSIDEKYIDEAFSHPEDIIDFFMYGSEFLFYEGWKKIADYLVSNGVQLSISTNGILLTPSNIQYLIDNEIVRRLNVSMDGATKETVESIRINVKFDKLIQNIAFLFHYAHERQYGFYLSISFVLMKRNYHELPELVRLIHRLRGKTKWLRVNISCHALENSELKEYMNFIHKEHHTLIDKGELIATFKEALSESRNTGIPITLFYSYELSDFIKTGCPLPQLAVFNSSLGQQQQTPIRPLAAAKGA